jgi:vacuolar protein sorting-associated protein 13A/C
VGQGIMEGGKTFGEGLFKGVTGIVADPLAGAKSGGMLGLMKGVGKGLVGVPGQIIGGALSGISKVTEGLDASVREVSTLHGSTCMRQRIVEKCVASRSHC